MASGIFARTFVLKICLGKNVFLLSKRKIHIFAMSVKITVSKRLYAMALVDDIYIIN